MSEPRGAWDATLVGELCAELDLVHGVDPFVTALVHGDIAYFRLHGIGGYRYRFTDDDLHRLVGWCRDALGANWKAVYVLFNNIAMLADGPAIPRPHRAIELVTASTICGAPRPVATVP